MQWKLSLVVYIIIPATVVAVAATAVVDLTLEAKMRQDFESAASLGRDCLLNVRDIFSSMAEIQLISQI
jgi:hypothetical protein